MARFDGLVPPLGRASRDTEPPASGPRPREDREAIRRLLTGARLDLVVQERANPEIIRECPMPKRVLNRARILAALALRLQAAKTNETDSERILQRAKCLAEEAAVLGEVEVSELPFFDRALSLDDHEALRCAAERVHGLPVLLWALRIVERRGERWPTLAECVDALEAFVARNAAPRLRSIFDLERAFDRLLAAVSSFHVPGRADTANRFIAEGRFRAILWLQGADDGYCEIDTGSVAGR